VGGRDGERGELREESECARFAANFAPPGPGQGEGAREVDPLRSAQDPLPAPPAQIFACARCHHVQFFSRVSRSSWDQLIAHLTAGLLYGSEVARPAWLTPDRKRPYRPQVNRAPSRRRQEVLDRWVLGWSRRRIAADLRTGVATVCKHVQILYRQHGVHTRCALATAVGAPAISPTPRLDQVRALLLAGKPYKQIAAELHLSLKAVFSAAHRVYAAAALHTANGTSARAALQKRYGQTPPPSPQERRDDVRRRLAQGQTCAQIARATARTYAAVHHDIRNLRRDGNAPTLAATAERKSIRRNA
jgi:DNA-binding NarL/FixJ family response regulator